MKNIVEQESTEEYNELFKELTTVLNKAIKENKNLDLRDFLSIIGTLFVDIVRLAELSDPENTELNRFRAISYVSQLIFNDEFRNHKKNWYN